MAAVVSRIRMAAQAAPVPEETKRRQLPDSVRSHFTTLACLLYRYARHTHEQASSSSTCAHAVAVILCFLPFHGGSDCVFSAKPTRCAETALVTSVYLFVLQSVHLPASLS
jgi:hypothetical protein